MEVIQKQINKNNFRSHFKEIIPSYKDGSDTPERYGEDEGCDYGKVPVDIVLNDDEINSEIFSLIPLTNGKILRYGTMMRYYFATLNAIKECTYKVYCVGGFRYITDKEWGDDFKEPLKRFTCPEISLVIVEEGGGMPTGVEIGTKICILNSAALISLFGEIDDGFRKRIGDFVKFVEDARTKSDFWNDEKRMSVPFMSFDIFIDNSIYDSGEFTALIEQWIPNKKYYANDITYYGDEGDIRLYRLELSDGEEYYKGYFDKEKKITYFDEVDENGELIRLEDGFVHWKIWETEPDTDEEEGEINIKSESKLGSLMHRDYSYDENGEQMPFVLLEGRDDKKYVTINFLSGIIMNATPEHGSEIIEIRATETNGTENILSVTDVKLGEEVLLGRDGEEMMTEIKTKAILIEQILNKEIEKVIFDYVIDGDIDESGDIVPNTGMRYHEEYPASIETYEDGTQYLKIVFDSMLNERNLTFDKKGTKEDTFWKVDGYVIKKEDSIGLHFRKNNINADIERGAYSAFECHNILSEINTIEDLENYRNNYFGL